MKSKLLLTLFLFLTGTLFAQEVQITGMVTETSGGTLPGVNIVEKGTTNGTVTDQNGNYSISLASAEAVLHFSYVGYLAQEIAVDGRTIINLSLEQDVSSMEEVVVIGYGTIKKKDLTGAVSVVNTESFKDVQSLSVGDALQGLASGVTVRSDGNIGAEPNIIIRGIGNISNNNPLYVIDGLITTGGIRDLNVNDIASVQILKDASAAAIYGNRAANGVIIITTKRGTRGEPMIDFSVKYGIEKLPSLNLMDTTDFFFYNDMAYENAGRGVQDHYDNSTDWEKEALRTGYSKDYNLGISGGSENSSYLVSANYFKNTGTFIGTDLERFSVRINTEATKGILTVGENVAISNTVVTPYSGGNAITDVMRMTPDIAVYDSTHFGGYGFGDESRARTFGTNPIAIQNLVNQHQENARIRGNIYGEAQIFKFLKYRMSVGYETSFDAFKRLRKEGDFTLNLPYEPSHVYENKARYQSFLYDNLLTFEKTFGLHGINAVLGSSYQRESYEQINGLNNDIFVSSGEYLNVLDAGSSNPKVGGFRNEIYRISYFGRVNYNFNEKYLLSATLRRDATSQFAPGYRTGYFPSASMGWRMSEEDFFNVDWMDNLKIRASYGELGNSAFGGKYDYIPSLTTFPLAAFGTGEAETILSGATQRKLVNQDLTWETSKQTNFGADLGFLRNRLQMSADYYISVTEDVLITFPILIATGNDGGNPWVNAGSLKNSGVELDLTWKETKGDLKYSVSGNFTTIKNEVLDLPYGDSSIVTGLCITEVGQPMAMFYLVETDGIFQSPEEVLAHVNSEGTVIQPDAEPGDLRYVDYDDNGIISAAGDRQIAGNPWPKIQLGLQFYLSYKNFDVSMQGFGAIGQTVYNGTRSLTERFNDNSNYRYGVNPWTDDNRDTDFPRVVYADERNSLGWTDRWLENGSYFKIQQLTLGYTFNIDPIQKIFNNLRASVTIQNPITFTGYKGLDPEFNNWSVLEFGVDGNSYPSPRILMFSLSAKF
jgi:TonB-dependent starch-binding outer membrane protein SusC